MDNVKTLEDSLNLQTKEIIDAADEYLQLVVKNLMWARNPEGDYFHTGMKFDSNIYVKQSVELLNKLIETISKENDIKGNHVSSLMLRGAALKVVSSHFDEEIKNSKISGNQNSLEASLKDSNFGILVARNKGS